MARSRDHRFEDDAVAEAFELEQCAATVLGVVAGDEVVATEIVWVVRTCQAATSRPPVGMAGVGTSPSPTPGGAFTWTEGNIGAYIDQDVVLAYGKTYNGWTIRPTRPIRSLRE